MAICKAGQSGFNDWGEEAILTEDFLAKDHKTWESGKVSINHENNNALLNKAKITDLEYEEATGLVWATFPDLPEKTLDLINSDFYEGLSQECIPLEFDGNKILKGYGLGVTIVTYPYKPAATPDMGVGVRPTESMLAAISSKYPEFSTHKTPKNKSKGSETIPEDELEKKIEEMKSTVEALKAENKELKSTNEQLVAQVSGIPELVKTAVSTALASDREAQAVQKEYDSAVQELSSFMKAPEKLSEFLSNKPTAAVIRATTAAMRATIEGHIGSSGGNGGNMGGQENAHVSCQITPDPWKGTLGVEVK